MSSTLSFEQFVAMKLEYQAYLASQSATAPPPNANTSSEAPKKKGRNRTPEQKEKWNAYMREYKAKRKAEKRGSKPSESSTSESDAASS